MIDGPIDHWHGTPPVDDWHGDCEACETVEATYEPVARWDWGPGEWTDARHLQVAAQLDYVAAAYEWKARPFRDRADQHRRAAQVES